MSEASSTASAPIADDLAQPGVLSPNRSGPPVHRRPVHNRLAAVLEHVLHYSMDGTSRLARDAGVSPTAVSRLINGHSSPSFHLVCALTCAIERHLGRRIDPRDLVSIDGSYPTPSAVDLTGRDENSFFSNAGSEMPSTLGCVNANQAEEP